ncbi:MAG: hypothetical protein EBS12_06055, partial [Flavobacteriia bacterium]|nr:hypothetical protein [Flavobacteriia bacterium]
ILEHRPADKKEDPITLLLNSNGGDVYEALGIIDYNTKISSYSGGWRMRLAIAKALIIKPKVLISRINALLRRLDLNKSKDIIDTCTVKINRENYTVEKNGETFHLPLKEFELLALLISQPNFVFKRIVILEKVWGTDIVVGDRTIDVHIRKLREKIGSHYITTIKGIGYKFNN